MSDSERKLLQYLAEAHAAEIGQSRALRAQVMITPRGAFRRSLEAHINETSDHARRLRGRMNELGRGGDPLQALVSAAESVAAQVIAVGKVPFDLVRGDGGEEKVLKNAKDDCAAEALEIATYTALESLASSLEDDKTAKLAASIRADEERMLDRLLKEIPRLTSGVVDAEVGHVPSYDITETGAADTVRQIGNAVKDTAQAAQGQGRKAARNARKIPGVARAEGELKGAVASEGDLAIRGYDELTAEEIVDRLPHLSQIDLAKIDAYERRNQDRSTILSRIGTLQASEPWPGYDELTVADVRRALGAGEEDLARGVLAYERSHKARSGVIEAAERERERASA